MALGDVPKYQAISSDLRSRIERAEFGPGQQLPSQHAMADGYGVTVMTLRQAIAQLENEGLVYASKGKGTFVSERPSVPYDLDNLSGFVQQMTRAGVEVSTSTLAVRLDSTSEVAAQARSALGLADGVDIVEIELPVRPDIDICSVDGMPVVVVSIDEMPVGRKPCHVRSKGLERGVFVRTHDGLRPMDL